MAGRYTDWRHRRGGNDRPDLVSYSQKLLGHLSEQIRMGAPPTLVIRRQLPDGSYVEAKMINGMPQVSIKTPPSGGRPTEPDVLDGFIVRPSPPEDQYLNADKNHVVLQAQPWTSDRWKAHFFDGDAVPLDYDLPHGFYGVNGTYEPPFPNGLDRYGNIDWRNAKEDVMVTFFGPTARYFGKEDDYRTRVFFKASTVLNVADLITDYTDGHVRGACLRLFQSDDEAENFGLCLLVIVRYPESSSTGFVRKEVLYRVPVQPTQSAEDSTKPGVSWKFASSLETKVYPEGHVLEGEIQREVIGEWELHYAIYGEHPWMFNQSGTEARAIRYYSDGAGDEAVIEAIVNVEEGTYTEESTALAPAVHSTSDAWTAVATPFIRRDVSGSISREFYYDGVTVSYVGQVFDSPPPDAFDPVTSSRDVVVNREWNDSITPAQTWVVCAVDFRDDLPVYAEFQQQAVTATATLERDIDGVYETSRDGTDTSLGGGDYRFITNEFGALTASSSLIYAYTKTTTPAGLRTDWTLYETPVGVDSHALTEESEETASVTQITDDTGSPDVLFTAPGQTDYTNTLVGGTHTETDLATGSVNHSVIASASATEYSMFVWHLDLRYRLLAVLEKVSGYTTSINETKTIPIDDYEDFVKVGSDVVAPPRTRLMDTLARTRIFTTLADVAFEVNDAPVVDEVTAPRVTDLSGNMVSSIISGYYGFGSAQPFSRGTYSLFFSASPFNNNVLPNLEYTTATTPPGGTGTNSGGSSNSTDVVAFFNGGPPRPVVDAFVGGLLDESGLTRDHLNESSWYFSGSWAAYRGKFCYSMALPYQGTEEVFFHGLGRLSDGAPSGKSIATLTGVGEGLPRFHPISILTPTAPR